MDNIKLDIKRIFKEHELCFDYFIRIDGTIEVHVEWGDWKHDHFYLDYIMEHNGYRLKSMIVTEENGSDCYSSVHLFEIFK